MRALLNSRTGHRPRRRERGRGRRAVVTAGVVALAVLASPAADAHAGTIRRVQTAPSPSTGELIRGGGTWIVNKPSGYYLGRVMAGGRFNKQFTSPNHWHYGRALNRSKLCGFAMPRSMGKRLGHRPDSCSTATKNRLKHRLAIGRDFNAPPHQAGDGTKVTARRCTLFYNYFRGNRFARGANGGHWANKAGKTTAGHVYYRFTTLDGRAAVVRDPNLGWGFVRVGCIAKPKPEDLNNDND